MESLITQRVWQSQIDEIGAAGIPCVQSFRLKNSLYLKNYTTRILKWYFESKWCKNLAYHTGIRNIEHCNLWRRNLQKIKVVDLKMYIQHSRKYTVSIVTELIISYQLRFSQLRQYWASHVCVQLIFLDSSALKRHGDLLLYMCRGNE